MPLIALGINHQTAPVSLRERVAFAPEAAVKALSSLKQVPGVDEAAILSTCNRTEIYCAVQPEALLSPARWLCEHHALSPRSLDDYLYRHDDAQAVRHIFRVATGLDSMVLGEPQILGQVKEAWQLAHEAQTLRAPMDRLFQHTFAVAKRVRTDTRIGANPVSVAFAAVRLAERVFADLREATVLLIGAGETIELAARHLLDRKAQRLIVANRTLEHAQTLASRFGGYAIALADLDAHLAEADVVISSTAAREPVLYRTQVEEAIRRRRHRPMFMVDIAVPRDIEPSVGELPDVYLYTIDDLDRVIADGLKSRREAAREAEAIIELQVEHYMAWRHALEGQGPLRTLRHEGESTREELLQRAQQMLARGKSADEVLAWLAHSLTNRLLHAPSANLREAALRGDADLLGAAERLFQMPAGSRDNP
jgi:glutamyl-tRNA reductase